jgi:hypothetical protein
MLRLPPPSASSPDYAVSHTASAAAPAPFADLFSTWGGSSTDGFPSAPSLGHGKDALPAPRPAMLLPPRPAPYTRPSTDTTIMHPRSHNATPEPPPSRPTASVKPFPMENRAADMRGYIHLPSALFSSSFPASTHTPSSRSILRSTPAPPTHSHRPLPCAEKQIEPRLHSALKAILGVDLQLCIFCCVALSIAWSPTLVASTLYERADDWLSCYAPALLAGAALLCLLICTPNSSDSSTMSRVGRAFLLGLFTVSSAALISRASAELVCDPIVRTTWVHLLSSTPSILENTATQSSPSRLPSLSNSLEHHYYFHVEQPLSTLVNTRNQRRHPWSPPVNATRRDNVSFVQQQDDNNTHSLDVRVAPEMFGSAFSPYMSPNERPLRCTLEDTSAVFVGRHSVTVAAIILLLTLLGLTGFLFQCRSGAAISWDWCFALAAFQPNSTACTSPASIALSLSFLASPISFIALVALNSEAWDWRPIYAFLTAHALAAYVMFGILSLLHPTSIVVTPSVNSTPKSIHAIDAVVSVWLSLPRDLICGILVAAFT